MPCVHELLSKAPTFLVLLAMQPRVDTAVVTTQLEQRQEDGQYYRVELQDTRDPEVANNSYNCPFFTLFFLRKKTFILKTLPTP